MISIYYYDTPHFTHDCKSCEFIKAVSYQKDKGNIIPLFDYYESCEKNTCSPHLLRYSSKPEDYSTLNKLSALAGYAMFMKGITM